MINYLKSLITNSPTKLISYADYIGAALYCPELGYYMKNNEKIGPRGDFITTSNVSDIFGRTLAKWFASIYEKNQLTPAICEIGAGNGRFAKAFLQEWNESVKTPLTYIIVESSPYHLKLQSELLNPNFSVKQIETVDDLTNFEGIIFSNELFDALPVHVIEKHEGEIYEIMIGINNEELFEEKVRLTNKKISQFLLENEINLKEKQRMEIPINMGDMLQKISNTLLKGLVVTVDYGYTKKEWMEPSRVRGSLRGYSQHKMIDNVLKNPGEMDITSHIHFDWLIERGEQLNLNFVTKLRQDEFLLKTGILTELENHFDSNPFSEVSKRNRAIRSLIMPSGMSSSFHVLIQQKGLEQKNVKDLFEQ
ncbi:SAM-dependent methyltransferase [Neobacillus sp. PS3-40]|uniref:class I SAM-dependent methyltransferase n=1 Tax=Neobacillus sp. PS3-40 TaxID=3070679 RepID=UPI0027E0DABE|nr:SAM-dependent methyltransferase [Neobacillus sp. PS3-40]WML45299.1 SAM-dependent methyltransferase [Neobacillus sp. PS3-40]